MVWKFLYFSKELAETPSVVNGNLRREEEIRGISEVERNVSTKFIGHEEQ